MVRHPRRAGFAIVAAMLLPVPGAATDTFPARAASIDISVPDVTIASVVETYVPDAAVGQARFEFLAQPCSIVEAVSIRSAGRELTVGRSRRGPWTGIDVDAFGLDPVQVRYDVRLHARDAAVPIVLPSAPLASAPESRGADVSLDVRFGGNGERASVVLPRLDPVESGQWRAHLLAIPSVVRIHLPGQEPATCESVLSGSTGGLEWRFWIFVATMGLWIPIYFWWFSREGDAP